MICQKICYPTKKQARRAMGAVFIHRNHRGLTIYKCTQCHAFHLGRRSNSKRVQRMYAWTTEKVA